LNQAAAILQKLCVCGPLLFIGLLMAIDPASVFRLSGAVARALHRFEHGLRGFPWQEHVREIEEDNVSEAWRIALGLIGFVLVACAILFLAAAPAPRSMCFVGFSVTSQFA
jgi:hypothetical protein